MADATPAACYAHANHRRKTGEIFAQVLTPRFGDGVDVIIGPGRTAILDATKALSIDLATALPGKGFAFVDSLEAIPPAAGRVVTLFPNARFDLAAAAEKALDILSRNRRGFFLMVESNNHSKNPQQDLDRMVAFDRMIRSAAARFPRDTLILFTADHSFDLRLPRGLKGQPILPNMKVEGSHTAEEVLVAGQGPGAERIRGILPNTQLFHIMMAAYGWSPSREGSPSGR
jgi:alkaline phosphatase